MVRQARQILTGWENLVLEINGEYVFRFPKFKEAETRLKTEIRLLAKIRTRLSTPVPHYTFVWRGGKRYRHYFGGYPKLRGVTLTKRSLGADSLKTVSHEIFEFLKALHNAHIQLRGVPLPKYSKGEWLKSQKIQYRRIRKTVYPLLNEITRGRSELFWRDLITNFADADFEPTLLHGDLSIENLLFDPATWRITGVLDWGYAQVSDPALELAHLFLHKREVGEEVLKLYRPSDAHFETRVDWYVRSEPFFDIMWGVTHHWKNAVKIGLRNLKESLDQISH